MVAEGAGATLTRTLGVVVLLFFGCCRMPMASDGGSDSGVDAGPPERCWAPIGTVFPSEETATLASAFLRDGGPCFSTSWGYRLVRWRDGGIVELSEVDGALGAASRLDGIFFLETQSAANSWLAVQSLYFARRARGWAIPRTCTRGEPLGDAFACDGRVLYLDGGAGPVSDDWLDGEGVVYGLRDGGLLAGRSLEGLRTFATQPNDISWWAGDPTGLVTMSSGNVLSLFDADGGRRDVALPRDAGVGLVFRHAGRTFLSRSSIRFGAELCEVDALGDLTCAPGEVIAKAGEVAWAPPATGGGGWSIYEYVFDGGWINVEPNSVYGAPSGWSPDFTPLRTVQAGITVRSPNQRRALVWQGVKDGRDDLLLFEVDDPIIAAGVRSSTAWVSWDGGTLIAR